MVDLFRTASLPYIYLSISFVAVPALIWSHNLFTSGSVDPIMRRNPTIGLPPHQYWFLHFDFYLPSMNGTSLYPLGRPGIIIILFLFFYLVCSFSSGKYFLNTQECWHNATSNARQMVAYSRSVGGGLDCGIQWLAASWYSNLSLYQDGTIRRRIKKKRAQNQ